MVHKFIFIGVAWAAALALSTAATTQFSSANDVVIFDDGNTWLCDQTYCPQGTVRCHVRKYNSPHNMAIMIHKNECYASDNQILEQHTYKEHLIYPHHVSLDLNSYSNGPSTSRSAFSMRHFNSNYIRTNYRTKNARPQHLVTNMFRYQPNNYDMWSI